MSPSAIMARSIATQRMLLAASSPIRSPFAVPCARKKARAVLISAARSFPVAETDTPPPNSRNRAVFGLFSSRSKMVSKKFKPVLSSQCENPYFGQGIRSIELGRSAGNAHPRGGRLKSLGAHRLIRLCQLLQRRAEWRQVIFPASHPASHRKLRVPPLHVFFKVDSHACHQLQISDHRTPNPLNDPFPLFPELIQRYHQLAFQL